MYHKTVFFVLSLVGAFLSASNDTKWIVFTPEINAFYSKLSNQLAPREKYDKIAEAFPEFLCAETSECSKIRELARQKEFIEKFDFRVIVSMSVTSALLIVIIIAALIHFVVSRRIPLYTKPNYQKLLNAVRRAATIMRSSSVKEAEKIELQALLKQLFEAQHEDLLRSDEHKKAFPLDFNLDPKVSQDEQLKRVLYGDPKIAPLRLEGLEGGAPREDS